MEDNAAVEDIVHADIFLYGINIKDETMIARRSVGKHCKRVRLLRNRSPIAKSSISTLSSKTIVVHFVINSAKRFSTWRGV